MDSRLEQRGSAGSTSVAHGCAARGAGSVTAVPCDGLFRSAETNSHRNNDCYTFMGGGSYRTGHRHRLRHVKAPGCPGKWEGGWDDDHGQGGR